MKTRKTGNKWLSFLLALCLVFSMSAAALAAELNMSADKTTVKTGETVTLTLSVSEAVTGTMAGVGVHFDTSLFELSASQIEAPFELGALQTAKDGSGYYTVSHINLEEAATAAAGTFATLTFKAVKDVAEDEIGSFYFTEDGWMDEATEPITMTIMAGGKSSPVQVTVTCAHAETEVKNAKEAACTDDGYTGDTVCKKCGAVLEEGSVIPAAHKDADFNAVCDVCSGSLGSIKTASVNYTAQTAGSFLIAPQNEVTVDSNLAESYGFTDGISYLAGVSALDVMVKAHEDIFGESFTKETAADYLVVGSTGYVSTLFGITTYANGFMLNGGYPNDGTASAWGGYNGTTVSTTAVTDGDLVEFYTYQDDSWYSDYYAWIETEETITAGVETTVTVKGVMAMMGYMYQTPAALKADGTGIEDAQLALVNTETGEVTDLANAVTDEDGAVKVTFAEAGTYVLTAYMPAEEIEENYACPLLMTLTTIRVEALKTGDVNVDGEVDLKDVSLLYHYYCGNAEISELGLTVADAFADEMINLHDVAAIYRICINAAAD